MAFGQRLMQRRRVRFLRLRVSLATVPGISANWASAAPPDGAGAAQLSESDSVGANISSLVARPRGAFRTEEGTVTDSVSTGSGELQSSSNAVEATLQKPDVHKRWHDAFKTPANAPFYDLAFDHIVNVAGVPEGATFLDAGCGIGDYAVRLAKRGMRVVAVDFAENVLKMARENVERSGLQDRIKIQHENLLSLSFDDEMFDAVLCWGVLMHIPDVERAIAELARVVRRGGVVVISEGNMYSLEATLGWALRRVLGTTRAEVRRPPAGREYWATTSAGVLVTREADIHWLIARFEGAGFTLIRRVAGQFTELYTRASSGVMQALLHRFNGVWFKYLKFPQPAFGNLLMLRKRP